MSEPKKELVLGVGAGIAAYKACDLLRRLQDFGFGVTVVPTPSSLNFVGKTTWEALSGRQVNTQVWEDVPNVAHIALADRSDYLLVAPATADLIARIAHGRADDLLTNVVLATQAPIFIVPAMHPQMWLNAATIANVELLRARGITVMEPHVGRLTGSDSGIGRFPDTESIILAFKASIGPSQDLLGKRILITAGGTREEIDPVRYIGNRSSGKQGYALAAAAISRGARVQLIAANTHLPDVAGAEIIKVGSTAQMHTALEAAFAECDALIMCAAVADARPLQSSAHKIKSKSFEKIELTPNEDLLASVAHQRRSGQILVGFAAETEDGFANAQRKIETKGIDLIYVNDVSGGAIFNSELTHGWIIDKDGYSKEIAETTKDTLANELLDMVSHRLGLPNV